MFLLHVVERGAAPRAVPDQHDISSAVMNNQPELIEAFIVGNETVRAFERIIVTVAIHLKRGLHGLAAKRIGIGMLGARHYLESPRQEFT